jgi:cytochrome P450 family 6
MENINVKYYVIISRVFASLVLIQLTDNQIILFPETLRKYPPLAILNRVCTKRYEISGTNIILEKGMQVVIPTLGLHYDPQFFPDPEKFDPERFSEEAKSKRHRYVYLPFGEGPRICIGKRYITLPYT